MIVGDDECEAGTDLRRVHSTLSPP
jgi:hypothetical protein